MSVLYAIYDPPTSDLPFLAGELVLMSVDVEMDSPLIVVSAVPYPTREQAEDLIEESVRLDGADPREIRSKCENG